MLLNAKQANIQLYHVKNKLHFDEMIDVHFVQHQHADHFVQHQHADHFVQHQHADHFDFYSVSSLKQLSVGLHVTPL